MKLEVKKTEELNNLTKGKLVNIIGKYNNEVDFNLSGRVYNKINGFTIKLIDYQEEEIELSWIRFDETKKDIIIKGYKGNSYDLHYTPELYNQLLNEWYELLK